MIEIPLAKGHVALIDDEDAHLAELKWYLAKNGRNLYAIRSITLPDGRPGTITLHRMVMPLPKGMHVDHIDGNGLDCRRQNLRAATHKQNLRGRKLNRNNKSGYKGVFRPKGCARWYARIVVDGRQIPLGTYGTAEDAARAYDDAAIRYFGEFARLNSSLEKAA
jgi:hypothetical protein